MVAVPAVDEVNTELHVAVSDVVPAARVQFGNVPVTPETAKATKPVGVLAPLA